MVYVFCRSLGQNRCNNTPVCVGSSSDGEYSCNEMFQALQDRLCSVVIYLKKKQQPISRFVNASLRSVTKVHAGSKLEIADSLPRTFSTLSFALYCCRIPLQIIDVRLLNLGSMYIVDDRMNSTKKLWENCWTIVHLEIVFFFVFE